MVSGVPAHEAPLIVPVDGDALETRHQVSRTLASDPNARSLVACGSPTPGALPGQQVIIANPETASRCPPQQVGEIWVAGPHVAKGYWNRSEATRATFEAYLADTGEGPFLRTGDLGFLRNGELVITGRLKDLIVLHGRNLYPQDVEWTTEHSHPALAPGGAAAFSVDTGATEQLVVVQALVHRQRPDLNAVLGRIRQAIAEAHEACVHEILLIKPGSLPKTSSGKVQRQATRTQYLSGALQVVASWRANAEDTPTQAPEASSPLPAEPAHETDPPASPPRRLPEATIRAWLVAELARKLGMSPAEIDIHQPFTYYGIASVEGVALAAKLENYMGRTMPLSLIWDYPSIHAVSQYLSLA
jgi:acyl carrier protein